ncbi:phosphoribosyltransferase [Mycoplasmoides pirum]|uniref:phosphoribosyltransferase n=1 Tax=Mycoplasmoides pirum TaxID=2122 RepID=UPI00048209FA|nr:phosphoribosyltransferase family protein [Mycoplasmoides pirum]
MTKNKIDPAIEKILFTYEEILAGIKKCANWINRKIKLDEEYIMINVLKGSLPFGGHLLPLIKGDIKLDFFSVSSYQTGTNQTIPRIILDTTNNVENKNVIIVEDIIDSGTTLKFLIEILKQRKAKSIILISLFHKKQNALHKFDIDMMSPLTLPNEWVVGFGLDCNNKWRNLPYLGILKKEYRTK